MKKSFLHMKERIFSLLWVKDKGKGEKPFIILRVRAEKRSFDYEARLVLFGFTLFAFLRRGV